MSEQTETTVEETVDTISETVDVATSSLSDSVDAVSESVAGIVDDASDAVAGAGDAVANVAESATAGLAAGAEAVTGTVSNVVAGAGDAVADVAESATAGLAAGAEAVTSTVSDVVAGAGDAVADVAESATAGLAVGAEAVTGTVSDVVAGAGDAVADVAESATAGLAAGAEAVSETVSDAVAGVGDAVADVAESATAGAEAVTETVSDAVAGVGDAVADVAESATVRLSTGAEAVSETVSDAVAGAGQVAAAGAVVASGALAAADNASAAESNDADGGDKKVVRVLSVGQEVEGVVKRIAEFGAFVDIGVGRDGLLHVSELSLQRVAKVADVLKQGQTITVWIKELDRERNRISLTMISPDTKTIRDLEEGELVEGTVSRIMPYGAFIDIGVGRDALLHVREMSDGFVKRPEDVVTLGETVEARIVSLSRRRQRIDLSLKGLRPEAEAEAVEEAVSQDEEAIQDPFENVEVLSPMELAFKRAMEGGDVEDDSMPAPKQGKRRQNRRQQVRAIQDEIIARTLANSAQK